ncbi:uncharacterized protein [Musca autumnalis]|uniref:uncharacterized protein n=1 Tax=Musca autumnalis TaxID=221902 RepID=UPI003CE71F67
MKFSLCLIALVMAVSMVSCESNAVDYETDYYVQEEEGGNAADYNVDSNVDYNEEWWIWDIFDWEWLVGFNEQQAAEEEPHHGGHQGPHHHHEHEEHVARPRLFRPHVAVA